MFNFDTILSKIIILFVHCEQKKKKKNYLENDLQKEACTFSSHYHEDLSYSLWSDDFKTSFKNFLKRQGIRKSKNFGVRIKI